MARTLTLHVAAAIAALACLLVAPPDASAQAEPADEQAVFDDLSDVELLDDLLFYVQINDYQQATRYGEELLRRDLEPTEFLGVVQELDELSRFVDLLNRARRVDSIDRLRAIADELESMYERGRRSKAREASEITRNIELLTEGARASLLGAQRLVTAGEYAMPQLLPRLLQANNPAMQIEVRRVMRRLGRHAVMPLAAALPDLSPAHQEMVVNLLGQIEYDAWLPYVYELQQSTENEEVRRACRSAIRQRTGRASLEGDVASWFYDLAERYYAEQTAVTSFPEEEFQLLWAYDPGVGLVSTPVRTPVYHEAMAMRLSERSLLHRTEGNAALPLWLASNFSREIDSPGGYENPVYPSDRPEAMYFATALGDAHAQWVLARALDTRDTPLARRAIAAIERTAGHEALRGPVDIGDDGDASRRSPLLEALDYPNRRVQYEAALALAASRPTSSFEGADRVVPLLASAIRDARKKVAVVVTPDRERNEVLRAFLSNRGYEVLAGPNLDQMRQGLSTEAGVNLMIVDFPASRVREVVERARADRRLRATPILVLSAGMGYADLDSRYRRDPTVLVRRRGIDESMLVGAVDVLLEEAVGGEITAQEAEQYASRSLESLRDLAVSRNAVLDVADAADPLTESLRDTSSSIQFNIAEVLSHIDQREVQTALVQTALANSGIARVKLLEHASASAKMHGNLLSPEHRRDVIETVLASRQGAEATAAATLMGSLGLSADEILPLVVGEGSGMAGEGRRPGALTAGR